jgi:PBSX family phage terminase large subunit
MQAMDKRINLLHGAVRSVKTVLSLVRFIAYVLHEAPEGRILFLGVTLKTLRDNICRPLDDLILSMTGDRSNFSYAADLSSGQLFNNECFFVGGNTVEAIGRLKGKTASKGGYFDEPDEYADGVFDFAMSRVDGEDSRIYATCNANSPYHPLKLNVIDRAAELGYYVKHFTIDDNIYLPESIKVELKRFYRGLFYKRYIDGLWVAAEGVIYDMFDPRLHVGDFKNEPFKNYIVSIDYGTANPCTFGLYGYDTIDRVCLVKTYWYDSTVAQRQKTDSEYGVDFQAFIEPHKNSIKGIYCDPSATSFIAELRKRGISVTKANNDVKEGIVFVSEMLSKNAYLIDRDCTHDQIEISGYSWDKRAQERGKDEPLKENDHSCDRTRYALYTHFAKAYAKSKQRHWK